jgi:hypothetical protein
MNKQYNNQTGEATMQENEQPKITMKAIPTKVLNCGNYSAKVEANIGSKPFEFYVEFKSYLDKKLHNRISVHSRTSGYEALSEIVDIDLKAVKLVGLKAISITKRHDKQKREMDSIIELNKQIVIRKTAIGIFNRKCQAKSFLQDYIISDGLATDENGKPNVYSCSAKRGEFIKHFDLHIRDGNVLVEITEEHASYTRGHYRSRRLRCASVNKAVDIIYSEYSSKQEEIRSKAARTNNTEKFLNGLNDTGYIANKAKYTENEIRIYTKKEQSEYSPSMVIKVNTNELTADVSLRLSPQQIIQVLEMLDIPKANKAITAVA